MCGMNKLRQIGRLLMARQAIGDLEKFSGPAFLLQAAPDMSDEDLSQFICPGESRTPDLHPKIP